MQKPVIAVLMAAIGLSVWCGEPALAQTTCPQSTIASNFNGTPIGTGDYIWFNANFTAKGIPAAGVTISFSNSTIQFTSGQSVPVPDAQITFSPSAACASTTFDTGLNRWTTTVPISGSDEIFLSGVGFPMAVGGKIPGPVTWQGTFGTDSFPGTIQIDWKWSAAVYSTFSTDYNRLMIKPTHNNSCLYNNSDHAGTPEGVDPFSGTHFKQFVVGGARGGGGSDWTGSWSGTQSVVVTACSVIMPGSPGIQPQ